ncbi:MAG TPA: type II toxin-antitoxin system RelE/ParE family toxin [Hymenobacter sp.]
MERLITRTDMIASFPQAGRIIPEYQDEKMRELIEGRYRIMYELIDSERADIIHIHHTARPLPDPT